MKKDVIRYFSDRLNRTMKIAIYGEGGIPVLAFPTQNGSCLDLEEHGMIDTLGKWIEEGQMQVYCVETVDSESWLNTNGDKGRRTWLQEQYYHFIVDEVIRYINKKSSSKMAPLVTGFSMGATHAAIVFLRRPELFSGLLAISGIYSSEEYFGTWMDGRLYDSTPTVFLSNMPTSHAYIPLYNNKRIIFCSGQGAFEDEQVRTLKELEEIFRAKGIRAACDYWGFDVTHDWYWWKKMVMYHMPQFLPDQDDE